MTEIKIRNEYLTAEIGAYGAELKSLAVAQDGTELIWKADEAVWGRSSPTPFPIMGGFPNDSYTVSGESFHMQKNGFARTMEFTVAAQSEVDCVLELRSNAETLCQYPFPFLIRIVFRLEGMMLKIRFLVENTGTAPMPYSIGAHTAFVWPRSNPRKSFVRFQKPETVTAFRPDCSTHTILEGEDRLWTDSAMFVNGAYSSNQYQSEWVEWHPAGSRWCLRLWRKQFPYLTLWSMNRADAEFLCIEPSIAAGNRSGEISERPGMRLLDPGELNEYMCCYQVIRNMD